MTGHKILHHPLHEWQDAQRRKDEPESRLRGIEYHFRWLCDNGYAEAAKEKWEEMGIALRWRLK
jgi:hypothetical protein